MRTLVHLSDLHFGRVDPQLLEPLRGASHGIAPRPRRRLRRPDAARAARRSSRRRAPSSTACRSRRSSCPATTTCRCTASASASSRRSASTGAYIDADLEPVVRRRRDRRARHQHRALADLQGRPHQRGADGSRSSAALEPLADGADQGRRHAPPVRPARRSTRATTTWSAARARRWRCSPTAASTCCWPATSTTSQAGDTAARLRARRATRRSSCRPARRPRRAAAARRTRSTCCASRTTRIAVERQVWQPEAERASRRARPSASVATATAGSKPLSARGSLSARGFLVLQQPPHHLARARLRQRVDELDDLRHLVGRHVLARPGDDVVVAGLALAPRRAARRPP